MITRVPLGSGWDSDAVLVDGRRVERTARRPGAVDGLRREADLLPWLAPRLPLPVPQPVVVGEAPLVVSHGFVPGTPIVTPDAAQGAVLGAFLAALHDVPLDEAVAHGLPGPEVTRGWRDTAFDRFADDVLPRLPDPDLLASRLERLRAAPATALVHGDLRPEHVLTADGRITGVIDWSDARAGDPAKDLVWPLLGTGPAVAAAVVEAYGADLTARADDWRVVAPCYAVVHGLDTGDEALVGASLAQLAAS